MKDGHQRLTLGILMVPENTLLFIVSIVTATQDSVASKILIVKLSLLKEVSPSQLTVKLTIPAKSEKNY